jgi:CHAT domain-containing protein/Flp pilus assembly protein TadD
MLKFALPFLCLLPLYLSAQNLQDTLKARGYLKEGIELLDKADYENAFTKLTQARDIYKKCGIWSQAAHCQNKTTLNLIRQGKFEQALSEAENVEEFGLKKLAPNNSQEAEWYNLMGEIYLNKGRNDLALDNFNSSLNIYQKTAAKNRTEVAQCLGNIGLVHWNTGKKELALEHHLQALSIRQSLNGENHPNTAASYNDIGLTYSQSDPDKALEYYQKALSIYQKIYGENHPRTANAYNNLAIINRQAKNYEQAIAFLEKVLSIREKAYGANHPNIAFVYANLGQVYLEQNKYLEALEYEKKALSIYQKNYGEKHPELANVYNLMGSTYLAQNKYNLALENFQKAIIANVPEFTSLDLTQSPDGKSYYNAGFLLNSLLLKAQALEARHFGHSLKLSDLTLALHSLEICDLLVESIRQLTTNKADKLALGATAAEVYEDGIRVCLAISEVVLKKRAYQEKAFYFAEKSKSAVLLAAISDSDAKDFAKIPQNLIAQEKKIKSDIAFLEQKLAEGPDAKTEKVYRDKLFNTNRQYESFIKELEQKYSDYYYLKYSIKTADIAEIQAIIDSETELISYFLSEKGKRLFIFKIGKNSFAVYDVPQIAGFDKQITALRNAIQYESKKLLAEVGHKLYKQLFAFNLKKSTKNLILIPDGRLGTIPFEVLLQSKTDENASFSQMPYLIKNYGVSYYYSATLLTQNLQKAGKQQKNSAGILLYAPVYFKHKKLNDLPATDEEIKKIDALFKAKNQPTKTFTQKEAQEKNLKTQDLKSFAYVHFATHGVVDEQSPELSQIFLNPDPQNKEDGDLFAGEIYNLEFDANLVALSACETALGKVAKGEGIIGLSRALLYAGARNLALSLWTVSDQSTAELMTDFYTNILQTTDNQHFAVPMRQAKLKMIQKPEYAAPYFWAPFILIGY